MQHVDVDTDLLLNRLLTIALTNVLAFVIAYLLPGGGRPLFIAAIFGAILVVGRCTSYFDKKLISLADIYNVLLHTEDSLRNAPIPAELRRMIVPMANNMDWRVRQGSRDKFCFEHVTVRRIDPSPMHPEGYRLEPPRHARRDPADMIHHNLASDKWWPMGAFEYLGGHLVMYKHKIGIVQSDAIKWVQQLYSGTRCVVHHKLIITNYNDMYNFINPATCRFTKIMLSDLLPVDREYITSLMG